MIDGGVRSGADVVKAVALGAKAVGLGRPFLYANSTHGQDGVKRAIGSEWR
jgi:L-lactate dehydrogenase (cytochrome)